MDFQQVKMCLGFTRLVCLFLVACLNVAVNASCDGSGEIINSNIKEELDPGTLVTNVNNNLGSRYSPPYQEFFFFEKWIEQYFDINYNTGIITTKVPLNREVNETYSFYIAKDTVPICITVNLIDVNDNAPSFSESHREMSIPERAPHHKVTLGSAVDLDVGQNTIAGYRLKSGNDDYTFNVTGRYPGPPPNQKILLYLGINGTLDFETTQNYTLIVEVYDGGNPAKTSEMTVEIKIIDTNDNHPIFNQSKYSTLVSENATVGTSILEVYATDIDSGSNGDVRYSIDRNTDPDEQFAVDPISGIIRLNKRLDYELKKNYKVFVVASDMGNTSNQAQAVFEVEVLNINELPADINVKYLTEDARNRIPENASKGFPVARVSVSDPESPDNDNVNIEVTLQGGDGKFSLKATGSVTFLLEVNASLDRETKSFYNMTLIAVDSGSPPLSASKSLTLYIEDYNDNPPVFEKNRYDAEVQEMSEAGSNVILVTATDADIGQNANITYRIENIINGNSDWFQVDSNSGLITTRGQVDCEVDSHPMFLVVASDHGVLPLSTSVTVVVSVRDINDKEPTFDQSLYTASIPENQPVRSCILQVNATDPDCGVNGQIRYFLSNDSSPADIRDFYIEEYNGGICVNKELDHETLPIYEFSVVAQDTGGFRTTANIQISVADINDNAPNFYPRNYSKNVQDNAAVNDEIIAVQASDADSGNYGKVVYSIKSGNGDGKFRIHSHTGIISLQQTLPAGERLYKLVIDAEDGEGLHAEQTAEVHISVTGPGYNPPEFERPMYRFSISEASDVNTTVGEVRATYGGSTNGIRYSIQSGDRHTFFKIDPVSGTIQSARGLDHDEYPSILLNIMATVGTQPLFGTAQVNITIEDINDNPPEFSSGHVTASISEDIDSTVTIYSAHATDKDSRVNGNGEVRYKLGYNPDSLFHIDATSGELNLQTSAKLNYEDSTQHSLVIVAYDQGQNEQLSATMTLVINVQDANDNAPKFTQEVFVASISEAASRSDRIVPVTAEDLDSGENGRITYQIVPSEYSRLFSIFPKEGYLYLKEKLDREMMSQYTLTVTARDHGTPSKTATATVQIYVLDENDNSPQFMLDEYHFAVEENLPSGTPVGKVMAYDIDDGNNALLQFDFVSPQDDFSISNMGLIVTSRTLDREIQPSYSIEVVCQDSGSPPRQAKARLLITVSDINDHAPVIQHSQFVEHVDENRSKGVRVVKIVADDPDAGDNGTLSFSLTEDGDVGALDYFAIHPKTGWITTTEVLDYEVKTSYKFKVVVTDAGSPSRSVSQPFEIIVNDDNDEAPVFNQNVNITFYIVENIPTGSSAGQVQAYDKDGGENGRVSYYIIGGNHFGLFSVDMEKGTIYTIREIDFEESSSHTIGIKAIDNSVYNPKSSEITIKFNVLDVNDNAPVFEHDPVILTLKENSKVGTVIHTFTAVDADSGTNGTVKYEIISPSENSDRKLEIDPYTGRMKVAQTIDYEQIQVISLVVKAYDQAPTKDSQLFTTLTVMVLIQDENDNAPVFQSYQPFEILEDEPIGYRITSIIATDADGNVNESGNNKVTYTIKKGNDAGAFTINPNTGVLTIASDLDREKVSTYSLRINARDHGSPYLESEITIIVRLLDVNDNSPHFLQSTYQANITEKSIMGSLITKVSAEDNDDGENRRLTYKISGGVVDEEFEIDPVSGLVTLKTSNLDREVKSSYILTAYVEDAGTPVLYDMATIIINVTDSNDSPPVFKDSMYFLDIPENTVQEVVYTFVAHDADIGDNANVRYSITSGNSAGKFEIDISTGVLSCVSPLDRETASSHDLIIMASDGKHTATCTLYVRVLDQNDNDPKFQNTPYSKLLFENVIEGTSVVTVLATDMDMGNNGNVSYSLYNDSDTSLFVIDARTGLITTKGTFDREKKSSYSFDAIASDGGLYDSRSKQVRVDVTIGDINDNYPIFQEVPYRKEVSQGMGGNQLVLTVVADDKDTGVNGEVVYRFSTDTNTNSQTYFRIEATGKIYTRTSLSNANGYHNLKVIAADKGSPTSLSATGVVAITVGTSGGGNTFQFRNQNYSTSLHEHAAVGSRVITVEVENAPSGIISYSFASGNDKNAYTINNGVITVRTPDAIDYEANHEMRLSVAAMSGDVYAYTTVWVNLIDINDNAPKFTQDKYVTRVHEEMEKFTYVMQVTATDADSPGPNTDIVYNIIQGNIDEAFIIDPPHTGLIKTNLIVDYEIRSSYRLIIEAKDYGENGTMSSSCTVKISVIDTNDNPPKFPNRPPVEASEATEVGSSLTMVTANDVDISPPVIYDFSDLGNPGNMFSIDRYSGMIRLAKPLDRERVSRYMIGLQASDSKHVDYTTLELLVTDENDNAPEFSQQSYQVTLEESTSPKTKVIQVNATDRDTGRNADITYSLAVAPSSGGFYINHQSGIIYTNETVQYRVNQEIVQLVVTATDNGERNLTAVVAVYIQIISVNQHPPKFYPTSYSTSVNENIELGFVVTHVNATDADTTGRNKEIDYKIIGGNIGTKFVINQKDGRIILNSELDRELVPEYHLKVSAQDRGIPPRNSSQAVDIHIIVLDVNDQVPYFEQDEYSVQLNESFPNETGFIKINAFDNDDGANSKLYFTITSGNEEGIFFIHGLTGEMFLTPNQSLDYESHSMHKLVIRVADCNGCESGPHFTNITTLTVNVTDVNEYKPEFPVVAYFKGVDENLPRGSSVFEAHANDKDGGDFGVVTYKLTGTTNNYFSIHYKTGLVTNDQQFDYETTINKEFKFQIMATDNGGFSTSINVTLNIIDFDEFAPVFERQNYEFLVPGNAPNGTFIGKVKAGDLDGGAAGKIVYRFNPRHNYFGINATTGEIRVIHQLNREIAREVSRRKREINTLNIEAFSGLDGSEISSVLIEIDVDRTCADCEMLYIKIEPPPEDTVNVTIIIVIVISVLLVLIIILVVVFIMRSRFHGKNPAPSETPMCDTDDFDAFSPNHTTRNPPKYNDVIRYGPNHAINMTTSSDMSGHSHHSGSSGRGSAEDDEDEELAMINSSSPSYLNNSNGFRKNMPDSGIQEDDNCSEPSIQNHQDYLARLGIDTAKINSKAKSGLTHSVESMHQFSDSGGGEGDGLEIDHIDYSKHNSTQDHGGLMDKNNDMGFHEPEPHMVGSLSNVINSEEEYSGSYNWDYLLDWGPQYQPLAHVFSEIARLKDDSIQPKKQAVQIVPQTRHLNAGVNMNAMNSQQVRMVPPPMITSAPPKAITQPSSRSDRSSHSSGGGSNLNSTRNSTINTSLPSMPRSPISHESSYTSPALTPSFTPSLSPLATRSPSISPVNSGRGIVSSNHSSGPATPRGRSINNNNNNYVFSSSSSEQELRI